MNLDDVERWMDGYVHAWKTNDPAETSPRVRLAVFVPRLRAAWPAARRETRAVRAMREVGMRSSAIAAED